MVGKIIGNYKITDYIAEGGMGTVYKAHHIHIDRIVAVKELHNSLASNIEFKKRFLNEAQILEKLSHPNIISIIDFLTDENSFYIITEYFEGDTLDKLIGNEHFYSIEDCKLLFGKILAGIDFAHKNGVIHRDIKPSNILVSDNNSVKILDFGIAKLNDTGRNLTKTGTKMGSLLYMSPEQILGKEIDLKTDIYSLGILLFEILTGKIPYNADTKSDYELMNTILQQDIPQLEILIKGIDPRLNSIIQKACAKDKENRFENCKEFAEAFTNENFYYDSKLDVAIGVTQNIYNKDKDVKSKDLNKTKLSGNSSSNVKKIVEYEVCCFWCSGVNIINQSELNSGEYICPTCNIVNKLDVIKNKMFKNPFSFKGRIRRLEYGLSLIIYYFISTILSAASSNINERTDGFLFILILIPLLVVYWFLLAQSVKRSHDINNSGFYILIPFYVLWLIFKEGESGFNEYGENSKGTIIKEFK